MTVSSHVPVLEQLHDDVTRLARCYVYTEPLPLMGEMVRVRNRVFRLLDRTQRPDQRRDLLLFAGQLCGLLASASFDLGYPDAATAQARSASTYGQVIGHGDLCAWAKGMQATVAFWHAHPREAVDIIDHAMTAAPHGTARVRLWCITARAWATLGNAAQVSRAVRRTTQEAEGSDGTSELHDSVGGQFGFTPARQAFCTGSAYLQASNAEQAMHACQRSVTLYEASAAEERSYKAELGARADLAAAYLLRHELDQADQALGPVFALSPQHRVTGLVKRLGRVRHLLTDTPYHNSQHAHELGERIDAFASETVTRALPAGPGRR